jgi:transposase-like protein
MSPKKITDTDKLELAQLYRQAGETTASLANRYGVSNSTISRILKTTIPEHEYEELIQQKRGAKNGSDEEVGTKLDRSMPNDFDFPAVNAAPAESRLDTLAPSAESAAQSAVEPLLQEIDDTERGNVDRVAAPVTTDDVAPSVPTSTNDSVATINEDLGQQNRRVRRRSSAPEDELVHLSVVNAATPVLANDLDRSTQRLEVSSSSAVEAESKLDFTTSSANSSIDDTSIPTKTPVPPPTQRTPVLRNVRPKQDEYLTEFADANPACPIETGESDEDEDDNPEDVNVLAAMFGEEIADGDEEDFEDDEEDEDDDEFSSTERQLDRELLTLDRLQIQVIPLSQAILPRTCYIVIDKFAELIVRPLKDFAELGQIPGEEIQQRTLPIFDNHRVAKRFSNQRTQRVIKVPDSKVFHKTSQHLRSKGITRLLVDGNIYSLN